MNYMLFSLDRLLFIKYSIIDDMILLSYNILLNEFNGQLLYKYK